MNSGWHLAVVSTLFFISSGCTRERTRPSLDPSLTLLDVARNLCAAPRATLQRYLASHGHQTIWLPDSLRAILDTMRRPHLESTFADPRKGLLVDDSGLVETLATENRPARYGSVSMQHLDSAAPFSGVGWIDLYFGPVQPDSSTPWGRHHADDTLFLQLQVFLVSKSAGWIVEKALYDGSWLSTRNATTRDLIRSIEQGRGCEIRMVAVYGS
jgi:hypothetical protein